MQQEKTHWSLDRRVPLALIVALVTQTATFVWWAAKLESRVEAAERQIVKYDGYAERMVRVETLLEQQTSTMREILGELRKK